MACAYVAFKGTLGIEIVSSGGKEFINAQDKKITKDFYEKINTAIINSYK